MEFFFFSFCKGIPHGNVNLAGGMMQAPNSQQSIIHQNPNTLNVAQVLLMDIVRFLLRKGIWEKFKTLLWSLRVNEKEC